MESTYNLPTLSLPRAGCSNSRIRSGQKVMNFVFERISREERSFFLKLALQKSRYFVLIFQILDFFIFELAVLLAILYSFCDLRVVSSWRRLATRPAQEMRRTLDTSSLNPSFLDYPKVSLIGLLSEAMCQFKPDSPQYCLLSCPEGRLAHLACRNEGPADLVVKLCGPSPFLK